MQKPTNTEKEARENPLAEVRMLMSAPNPSMGIEMQEAIGQAELVESESLPAKFGYRDRAECMDVLKGWGFEFGEPFADDPLFMPAKLPKGWSKKATGHSMHSSVIDDKGRERVGIFYKAASYDRKADSSICPRYRCDYESVSDDVVRYTARDAQTGEALKVFEGEFGEASDGCRAYLVERFGEDCGSPKHWTE